MKKIIKKIPVIRIIIHYVYVSFFKVLKLFPGSQSYWDRRYKLGGASGAGSYGKFAEFKAEIINKFVLDKDILSIIEYGCGDGNQLALSKYPTYIGFDVSRNAISKCQQKFSFDKTKNFRLMSTYDDETADLTLSLDVIYHLTEDEVFYEYIKLLFDSSDKYVIIYSSNTDQQERVQDSHVKHREFSKWIKANREDWSLIKIIPNRYPYLKRDGSFADFYIYEKMS